MVKWWWFRDLCTCR